MAILPHGKPGAGPARHDLHVLPATFGSLGVPVPLFARLADGFTMACRPRGLALVPTRELASQVQEVLQPPARAMGLSVTAVFGGTATITGGRLA